MLTSCLQQRGATVPCMAHGTLLQLDQTGSVASLGDSRGASLGQLLPSGRAFREPVPARAGVMTARSRLCVQLHGSEEHRTGNEEQAPEPSDRSRQETVRADQEVCDRYHCSYSFLAANKNSWTTLVWRDILVSAIPANACLKSVCKAWPLQRRRAQLTCAGSVSSCFSDGLLQFPFPITKTFQRLWNFPCRREFYFTQNHQLLP